MAVKNEIRCDPEEHCSCVEIEAQMADGATHCIYVHLPGLTVTGVKVHVDPPDQSKKP